MQVTQANMQVTQNEIREFQANVTKQLAQIQTPPWQQNLHYPHQVHPDQNAAIAQMQHTQVNQPEGTAATLHTQQIPYHMMFRHQ